MPAPVIAAIIGTAGSVAGSAIASRGNTKAAETAAGSADKELEFLKQSYLQERADNAPYRQTSLGALSLLSGGLPKVDLPPDTLAMTPSSSAPAAGSPQALNQSLRTALDRSPDHPVSAFRDWTNENAAAIQGMRGGNSLASLSGQPPANASIQAPNGKVYSVPEAHIAAALQAGGKRIS